MKLPLIIIALALLATSGCKSSSGEGVRTVLGCNGCPEDGEKPGTRTPYIPPAE